AALAHACAVSTVEPRPAALAARHPVQSLDRFVAVRRPDDLLALAEREFRRDAGLAALSPDELEHGAGRPAVLVADSGHTAKAAGTPRAGCAGAGRDGGDGAADSGRCLHHVCASRSLS